MAPMIIKTFELNGIKVVLGDNGDFYYVAKMSKYGYFCNYSDFDDAQYVFQDCIETIEPEEYL